MKVGTAAPSSMVLQDKPQGPSLTGPVFVHTLGLVMSQNSHCCSIFDLNPAAPFSMVLQNKHERSSITDHVFSAHTFGLVASPKQALLLHLPSYMVLYAKHEGPSITGYVFAHIFGFLTPPKEVLLLKAKSFFVTSVSLLSLSSFLF